MANETAFESGFKMGADRRTARGASGKKGKDAASSPDVDPNAQKQSGQKKLPWYTLGGLLQGAGIGSMKKGGPVRKTGLKLLHKGEYVVPAKHGRSRKLAHKRTVIKH